MTCKYEPYVEMKTGEEAGKSLWHYFQKIDGTPDNGNAICLLCSNLLKISRRSTKGLKIHLKTKHCIDISQIRSQKSHVQRPVANLVCRASTSKNDTLGIVYQEEVEVIPKKKVKTVDRCFKEENSVEKMVSRMVCKDGFTLNSFCTSSDLRCLFSKSGIELPDSADGIVSMVTDFSNSVRADMTAELERLRRQGQKFSLSFDEWRSQKNHRYLNLNCHRKETHFNLGLIRVRGSYTAEHCISLVEERLASFGLHLETDIIGVTTDGASVMGNAAKRLPCCLQLCFAHGIQLAVVDVLYQKTTGREVDVTETSLTESDVDDEDVNETKAQSVTVIHDHPPAELIPRYNDLVNKVRKVVKIFKKSPTKNEIYLQKYVNEEKGKELSLILDCRTRWDSVLVMVERFYSLNSCIDQALVDTASDIKFTEEEWSRMNELILCLQPLKLGVEALCRKESSLITADTILRFILDKLDGQETVLSAELSEALRARVEERRTELPGILIYLQNPKKYEQELRKANHTFPMPRINAMHLEMKRLLERVIKGDDENNRVKLETCVETADDSQDSQNNLSLEEELEMQIQREKEEFGRHTGIRREEDFDKILKMEMNSFESEGVRGKYLSLIHDYLMTVKPTSLEAERAFSAAGCMYTSVTSNLGDDTISTVCFLRSFFQNDK